MSSAADSNISLPDDPPDVSIGQEHKQRLVREPLPDDAISGHDRDHRTAPGRACSDCWVLVISATAAPQGQPPLAASPQHTAARKRMFLSGRHAGRSDG
jgi:hypothetical protein